MRIRVPRTLWRATFADLAKLITLSTLVLVVVVSLALAIKPLSDGYLSAADALMLMAMLVPPGLAYALPFGAGFGATLVYHRMAADREALAAHAGGISHRALLMPALVAGIVLMGLMVALTQEIIPRFLQSAQRVIAFNAARYIEAEIVKGRAVSFDQMQIFADSCVRSEAPAGSGATDVLTLERFAAIELGKDQEPVTEVTASRAYLWLFPPVDDGDERADRGGTGTGERRNNGTQTGQSRIVMRLENVVAVQQGRGVVGFRDNVNLSWSVPNTFRDSPKYLPASELARLRTKPERMNWMEQRRRALALALAQVDGLKQTQDILNSGSSINLIDMRGEAVVLSGARAVREGESLRLTASGSEPIALKLNREADVGASVGASGNSGARERVSMVLSARAGRLITTLGPDARTPRFSVTVQLERAEARRADAGAQGVSLPGAELEAFEVGELQFASDPANRYMDMSVDAMLAESDANAVGRDGAGIGQMPEPRVASARHEVARKLIDLEKDILSKRHERMAISVSALVMVLTGAIAAMRFMGRRVLGVYLWTFVPALASLVTIGGGSPMVGSFGAPGLILMWSGVVGLGIYTLVMYRGLTRH